MEIITLKKQNITDFAKERNELMGKSKDDWIFFVDSDEVVSDELRKEINKAIKNESVNGYFVNRKNFFLGSYVGSDKILRLVKKGSGRWERKVHEVFHLAGERAGALENPLIHNTADNLKDYVKRMDWYSTLHAEANKKEGKRATLSKIVFYPLGKFLVTYIKSGNVVFSIMQSFHSFLSWSKLYFLHS